MSVENVSSGIVPQGTRASDYETLTPCPKTKCFVPTAEETTDSSQQGLEFSLTDQLAADPEWYVPSSTRWSIVERRNIMEQWMDSAWNEAMQQ
ncbi:hypothetical protein Tco_0919463 [Tanacetum coccineum]